MENRVADEARDGNGWSLGNIDWQSNLFTTVSASTLAAVTSVNRVIQATDVAVAIQGRQVERDTSMPTGSWLRGGDGNDVIRGLAGWDLLEGGSGDDLIRAGNGRDILTGGLGSDELHGDFGWNTYTSERDGFVDLIVFSHQVIQ